MFVFIGCHAWRILRDVSDNSSPGQMKTGNEMTLITPARLAVCAALLWQGLAYPLIADELPTQTNLDKYIAKPDSSYRWHVLKDEKTDGMRAVVIDMVSQTWRAKGDVDRTKWQHWLTIAIPDKPSSRIGLLWIGGGRNGRAAPGAPSERIRSIAQATNTVVAELHMVPNQPVVFHNDGVRRSEDDLVAYTWDRFLKTGDDNWLVRNAMVKSAVRAMDTVTALTKKDSKLTLTDRFVVAGGSKRGWTTWLTGAVDKRVVGIAPIVIDVLNVHANMRHHFASYGFWAPAIGDYVEHRITERNGDPKMASLLRIVDPWHYRHRLTMPKFIINSAGDEFFLPDSSRFYYKGLKGSKTLRYVPNTNHSLRGSDAITSLIAWYGTIVRGTDLPKYRWETRPGGTIILTGKSRPSAVRLWQATNPAARDFRLESLGARYKSSPLSAAEDGTYRARLAAPPKGWTAWFLEATFDVGGPYPLKVTSEIRITPDTLPYEKRNPLLPGTITIRCAAPNEAAVKLVQGGAQTEPLRAIAKQIAVSHTKTTDGKIQLQVNWKPVGRFQFSASAMTKWLAELKCSKFEYRLDAGPAEPLK